jgi:hypothetical protein
MNMNANRFRRSIGCATACVVLFGSVASARRRPDHPYRYSVVDMPVSLALGTAETPEFSVDSHWYWIMVQVEKPLPFDQMRCMMGALSGPWESRFCTSDDPLLRARWTVSDGDHVLYRGSLPDDCACLFTDKYIFKFLGKFPGEAGRHYVVKVTFTKDGTPLNVAEPHLIVTHIGEE